MRVHVSVLLIAAAVYRWCCEFPRVIWGQDKWTPGHSKQNVVCPLVLEQCEFCQRYVSNGIIILKLTLMEENGMVSTVLHDEVVSRLVIDIWGSGRLGYDV